MDSIAFYLVIAITVIGYLFIVGKAAASAPGQTAEGKHLLRSARVVAPLGALLILSGLAIVAGTVNYTLQSGFEWPLVLISILAAFCLNMVISLNHRPERYFPGEGEAASKKDEVKRAENQPDSALDNNLNSALDSELRAQNG